MVLKTGRLRRPDGHELGYDLLPPAVANTAPGVVFLHGLGSDRRGTKVEALAKHCAARGHGFLRFDMYGHGESTGRFEDAGPGRWREDALALVDQLTHGPQVLIGSSMGAWVALLAARAVPQRVAGLILIAAAPDFTEDLWRELLPAQQSQVLQGNVIETPTEYGGPPFRFAKHLFDDGRAHLLLRQPIAITCPVRLLHGQQDASVPWRRSLEIAEKLVSPDVVTIFVKDGDHRLSRPADIALLCRTVDELTSP